MTEQSITSYISEHLRRLSTKLVYTVLLLYYAYRRKETPSWARRIIIGSIAYFLSPIDAIPDLTPFVGFTDDWGVLAFGLVTIACYINDDVRAKAKTKTTKWMGAIDDKEIEDVDKML